MPLAKVLSDELLMISGRRLKTIQGEAEPGDIVLALDTALKNESYTLVVADKVVVTGGNYSAVAIGTATFLQALSIREGKVTVPRLRVADEPFSAYRGLMVDVARKFRTQLSNRRALRSPHCGNRSVPRRKAEIMDCRTIAPRGLGDQ